jgi:ribosomal protein S18 acetylase RimI-like enzyme
LRNSTFRGLGIGKRLLTDAIGFCKEKKFKNVFLLTTSMQDKALQMYKMMGFELTKSEEVRNGGRCFMRNDMILDLLNDFAFLFL